MKVKAAMHVHSDWSYDGVWTLGDLAKLFRNRGYRVVMISEHDRGFDQERWMRHREACAQASSAELLLMPGMEYSDPENVVHITTWGVDRFLGEAQSTESILKRAAERLGFCGFAHPTRKAAWRSCREEWRELLGGIELWNRKTDGWAPSREANVLIDSLGVRPLAAMDFHTTRQWFPLSLSIEVDGAVDEASVLTSLRQRKFTAEVFGQKLDAFSSPVANATLTAAESMRRGLATMVRRLLRGSTGAK